MEPLDGAVTKAATALVTAPSVLRAAGKTFGVLSQKQFQVIGRLLPAVSGLEGLAAAARIASKRDSRFLL
jgi:hypothetical protein